MLDVAIGYASRQTPASKFSHWEISDAELLEHVRDNWENRQKGYRDGVFIVQVPAQGFFTGLVTLQEGDNLRGSFMPRKKGEEPRKMLCFEPRVWEDVGARKAPAQSVDVIVYHRDVLAEDGDVAETEWEVVSVNASPVAMDAPMPMTPDTLMANHYHASGGTQTNMTAEEFEEALRECFFFFWRDKAMMG